MSDWNANQYLKFSNERRQPSLDLIQRIKGNDIQSILDVGCGPGNSTFELRYVFPRAYILGIDGSEDMLNRARENHPELFFQSCFLPEGLDTIKRNFDLIFSNACIQWINHQDELIKELVNKLNDNGILAVQVPFIQESLFYKVLNQLIEEKWKSLSNIRNFYNLVPEQYYDVLMDLNMECEIWTTTYHHVLKQHSDVIQWYKGSGLRPYLDALNEEQRKEFENDLYGKIIDLYPVQKNGDIFLKMPRIFFVARKKVNL